jgi:hypothetical protein
MWGGNPTKESIKRQRAIVAEASYKVVDYYDRFILSKTPTKLAKDEHTKLRNHYDDELTKLHLMITEYRNKHPLNENI